MYAEILFSRKVGAASSRLTYEVPEEMKNTIRVGDLVKVPLRKQEIGGIVWKISNEPPNMKTRPIIKKMADAILLPWQIAIIEWLKKFPKSQEHAIIKKMIPEYILKGKILVNEEKIKTSEKQKTLLPNASNKTLYVTKNQSEKWKFLQEKIKKTIEKNEQVLVLTPEIDPVPVWLEELKKIADTEIFHGKYTEKKRAELWKKIAENEIKIVIASRLGPFAPVRNIRLIILTNEHDETYLEDNRPYVHTRDIALKIAEEAGVEIIVESTFPGLETEERSRKEGWKKIEKSREIKTRIIDMREELKKGNRTPFGEITEEKIKNALAENEQVILFLNKKGSASAMLCRDCGFVEKCEKCGMALTLEKGMLRCIQCKIQKTTPEICHVCGNTRIKFLGTGTEKIESWTRKIFPEISLVRIDRDTIKNAKELDEACRTFKNGWAKILIGTSLIRADLLPQVQLVVALLPDITLNYPDLRSSENTLQQLTLLKSMVKNTELLKNEEILESKGEMIIQTYITEHDVYKNFLKENWIEWYNAERKKRNLQTRITEHGTQNI